MTECPCGSGVAFASCCEPFLLGQKTPETAEQTMRARYTAHTRTDVAFLMKTLHPDNKQEGDEETAREWSEQSQWMGLEILATSAGGASDDEGMVEFVARFRDKKGLLHSHHERSTFVRHEGEWRFREGVPPEQGQVRRTSPKIQRNDPCPCGSGKKYKKCCERGD